MPNLSNIALPLLVCCWLYCPKNRDTDLLSTEGGMALLAKKEEENSLSIFGHFRQESSSSSCFVLIMSAASQFPGKRGERETLKVKCFAKEENHKGGAFPSFFFFIRLLLRADSHFPKSENNNISWQRADSKQKGIRM